MPIMQWHEGMRVGVETIDREHAFLVDLINQAFDAADDGRGEEVFGPIMKMLVEFTVEHFRHEEALFCQTDYPQAQEHKNVHADYAARIAALQEAFRKEGARESLSDLLYLLKDLMMNHAQGMDRGYVPYLQAKGFR